MLETAPPFAYQALMPPEQKPQADRIEDALCECRDKLVDIERLMPAILIVLLLLVASVFALTLALILSRS